MREIMNKYGKSYDYIITDGMDVDWEESFGGLNAICDGWYADIDDVKNITNVEVDEEDKIVYITTSDVL